MTCPHAANTAADDAVDPDFEAFIRDTDFPCVGAKAALVRGALETETLGDLRSNEGDFALWLGLSDFAARLKPGAMVVQSFAVLFPDTPELSEMQFERALWDRLQGLHYVDTQMGQRWAETTSNDPSTNNFSLSVAGQSFFVIGLHPGASRPARRFEHAALVFNSNAQFEALRADGRYYQMQSIIRERDAALAGSINPMLNDFGNGSEAAQYSGRRVDADWECPFSARKPVELTLKPAHFGALDAAE